MKLSELKRRYKEGASIEVLAELNNCPTVDITDALGTTQSYKKKRTLNEHYIGKSRTYKSGLRRLVTLEDAEQFFELYEEGYNDFQIGVLTNWSHTTISKWRRQNGLPPNRQARKLDQEDVKGGL